MSRRRNHEPSVDFFAFQDIVTATTGILIVITLLLSLSIGTDRIKGILEQRKAMTPSPETEARADRRLEALRRERDERLALQAQIEARRAELLGSLQAEVDALSADNARRARPQQYRRLIPPTQTGLEHPLLVVVQGERLLIVDQAGQVVRTLDGANGGAYLLSGLRQAIVSPLTGVLFLIKPSAFRHYEEVLALGRDTRAPYGFDIIPEDWEVGLQ